MHVLRAEVENHQVGQAIEVQISKSQRPIPRALRSERQGRLDKGTSVGDVERGLVRLSGLRGKFEA